MPEPERSTVKLTEPLSTLGVPDNEALILSELFGIDTVFDLGSSPLFTAALELYTASADASPLAGIGLWNKQLVKSEARSESLENTLSAAATVLIGLGDEAGIRIADTLGLLSVAELAQWPPFLTARNAVIAANQIDTGVPEFDPVEALRPQIGQYPVERFYYRQMVLLDQHGSASGTQELNGALQLAAVPRDVERKPLVGAVVTLAQSWYAQAVTLGQLLHSLALAPGEATRIAVIDWSRRSSANSEESIAEGEQLSNTQDHSRALSEVQEATAKDVQEGTSSTRGRSDTESTAAAKTFSGGFLLASSSASVSTQSGSTSTETESASWSVGSRSVTGQLAQNVNDRAEQNASVVRNRRASAVREVSQSEHEQVSTRIVANYNHMHALTIQYWEVVQLYRAVTELHEARRCLFIPIAMIDFDQPGGVALMQRHRQKLAAAALTKHAYDLLTEPETLVTIKAESTPLNTNNIFEPLDVSVNVGPVIEIPGIREALENAGVDPADVIRPTGGTLSSGNAIRPTTILWRDTEIASFSAATDLVILRPGSDDLFVSDELYIDGFSLIGDLNGVTEIIVTKRDTSTVSATVSDEEIVPQLEVRTRIRDIENITVVKRGDSGTSGRIAMVCTYRGRRANLPSMPVTLTTKRTRIASFISDASDRERDLIQHLSEHQAHYSGAIIRRLGPNDLVRILSEWTWNGKRLVDIVEPRPVAVTGDYLILSAPVDLEESAGTLDGKSWGKLLEERSLLPGTNTNERLIPIPTGGVFAEAVLGRSNSAEKLDITRFWNWAESPIPLTPPEISPVSTGSRATEENLTPSQLGSPILNITNPTTLPDPSGLSAVLSTLTNLNFRDMSGLAGNQQLAEALANLSGEAAATAGELTSRNLATEAQKQVALAQNAADLIKSGISAFGMPTNASGGSSHAGAMINHGQSLDRRNDNSISSGIVRNNNTDADLSAMEIPESGGTPTSSSEGISNEAFNQGSNASTNNRLNHSNESAAFRAALHGPLGDSAINAARQLAGVSETEPQLINYTDELDPLNSGELFSRPATAFQTQQATLLLPNFNVNDWALTEGHRSSLNNFVSFLLQAENYEILRIAGRASNTGPESERDIPPGGSGPGNVELSQLRAESVAQYLLDNNLFDSSNSPNLTFHGSDSPIIPAEGEVDANRSVLIYFTYRVELPIPSPPPFFSVPDPIVSREWGIALTATANIDLLVGAYVAFGKLRNFQTGETYEILFTVVGLGIGEAISRNFGQQIARSTPSLSDPNIEDSEFTRFETFRPIPSIAFDGRYCRVSSIGIHAVILGGSITFINIPSLADEITIRALDHVSVGFELTGGLFGSIILLPESKRRAREELRRYNERVREINNRI